MLLCAGRLKGRRIDRAGWWGAERGNDSGTYAKTRPQRDLREDAATAAALKTVTVRGSQLSGIALRTVNLFPAPVRFPGAAGLEFRRESEQGAQT